MDRGAEYLRMCGRFEALAEQRDEIIEDLRDGLEGFVAGGCDGEAFAREIIECAKSLQGIFDQVANEWSMFDDEDNWGFGKMRDAAYDM